GRARGGPAGAPRGRGGRGRRGGRLAPERLDDRPQARRLVVAHAKGRAGLGRRVGVEVEGRRGGHRATPAAMAAPPRTGAGSTTRRARRSGRPTSMWSGTSWPVVT